MPSKDNRQPDELANWLNQQVTPLPPPDGTFRLIKRRARRRKARRLAATVTAAAAVAVAVVVLPHAISLRLSPPSVRGNVAANSPEHPTPTAPRPDGSAARATTPASTPGTSSVTQPPPADFDPSSVTFAGTAGAWVLGQAGTPSQCVTSDCTSVASTSDTGQTWQALSAPGAGSPDGSTGVGGIRFLGTTDGWAFGPELWQTTDGGTTWTQVGTGGKRVTDLEAVGNRAFAVFATCSGGSGEFAANCTGFTLEDTIAGSGTWAPVGGATTNLPDGGPSYASLVLTGSTGYLLAPDGTLYSGPVNGSAAWQPTGGTAASYCKPGGAQANGQPEGAMLAAGTPSDLVLVCQDATGSGNVLKVFTSANGGASWSNGDPDAPDNGSPTSVADTMNGTIVLAGTSGIGILPDGASSWQQGSLDGAPTLGGGFSYVGMTSQQQGVALPADTKLHEIWLTTDGGQNWTPISIP